jgi:signal transduction histidine kinase
VIASQRLYRPANATSRLVFDGLLALFVTAITLASLVVSASEARVTEAGSVGFHGADTVGVLLVLGGTLPLVFRRRCAMLVLALSTAMFVVYEMFGYAHAALPFATLIALYSVAAWCPPPASLTATGLMVVGLVVVGFTYDDGPLTDGQLLVYVVSAVSAWMLGSWVQWRRAHTSLLEEQAGRLAREQADRTRVAIEQEQARIARELHDIVAHHVCVMVAQAGAAQRVFDAEPAQARRALGSIETTGREALVEMRRLLGVLRAGQPRTERAPQPGLERLPWLVAHVEQAGLPVELTLEGRVRPLPAGVELSAYRIVQEALTNTLKHARAARVQVILGYRGGWLELQVCDDGQGCAGEVVPGQGLVGMQQRAGLVGGELAVGSGPGGGFRVVARLPVDGERR